MLACCVPFAAFAEDVNVLPLNQFITNTNYKIGPDDVLKGGSDTVKPVYNVPSGSTLTVPVGVTLYIPTGTTLNIQNGGKLVVYGNIITKTGSTVNVMGSVTGAGNITGEGDAYAQVRFPALSDFGLKNKIRVFYATADTKTTPLKWSDKEVLANGGDVMVELNKYFCVKVVILDPECDTKIESDGYDITGEKNTKYADAAR